jgi:hypothetical protein
MAQRLASFPTLADYVRSKKWSMGEGFIAGSSGQKKTAKWLTGLPLLPTEGLTSEGIVRTSIGKVNERSFVAPRTEKRYKPPMMLIKEHDSLPVAFWDESSLAYKDKIVGINAPPSDTDELSRFAKSFVVNRNAVKMGCQLFGKQSLLGKATAILKTDIDQIPWPQDGDWDMSTWEKILADDLLNYIGEFIRKGQESKLLKTRASSSDVKGYTSCFSRILCKLYPELSAGETIFEDGLLGQTFFFGKSPTGEIINSSQLTSLKSIIEKDEQVALRRIRILRFYDGNSFIIVKPDRLRYWIRSVAIRDADDVIADLLRMEGF